MNICFDIVWVKIWTNEYKDPYSCNGNAHILHDLATKYWDNNYTSVERDLVNVLTAGGSGGRAWVNEVCDKSYGLFTASPYGQFSEQPDFNFPFDVLVVAHEIGHCFGAIHTHSCYNNRLYDMYDIEYDPKTIPFDTCHISDENIDCIKRPQKVLPSNDPTIMSYCTEAYNNPNMHFKIQNSQLIRKIAEQKECITPPNEGKLVLQYPIGKENYLFSESIDISLISYKVDGLIKISLSTDGGEKFDIVISDGTYIKSGDIFTWYIDKEICSNKCLIKVESVDNPDIFDISIHPFSIRTETEVRAFYPFTNGAFEDYSPCQLYPITITREIELERDRFGDRNASCSFNGTNSLMIAENFDAKFKDVTINAWVKPTGIEKKGTILDISNITIYHSSSLTVRYSQTSEDQNHIHGNTLKSNQWSLVTFTFDGMYAKLYINGELINTNNNSKNIPIQYIKNTPLCIGGNLNHDNDDFWTGGIDDIVILNRAMNDEEISNLYSNQAKSIVPNNISLIYPENKSIDVPLPITIKWEPDDYSQSYYIQIANDILFTDPILSETNISSTNYDFSSADYSSTYFCRLLGINNAGICSRMSKIYTFTTASNVSVIEYKNFSIRPNPFHDKLIITGPLISLQIIDILGNTVHEQLFEFSQNKHIEIDTSELINSIYFVKINGTKTFKILKKK
jgi:hypothetical protein